MAENEAAEGDPNVDEDGIQIQSYTAMVLVVVPPREFAEQTLRHARSSLYNVHVGTRVVGLNMDDVMTGRLQDEFLVDGVIADETMDDYVGVLFVGGEGAMELAENADAQRIAREASERGLMIGAWGHSVAILAKAGILAGKKVTGAADVADLVRKSGGKFTGRQLEKSGKLATCTDEAVGMRFGKTLAQIVAI